MVSKAIVILIISMLCVLSASCSADTGNDGIEAASDPPRDSESDAPLSAVQKISAEEGKQLMEELESYVLIDVRSADEFAGGHIEDAVLIPANEIAERAEKELPDKDMPIFVYCRSGARSANAAATLAGLGYTTVYDLGGIISWPYGITNN